MVDLLDLLDPLNLAGLTGSLTGRWLLGGSALSAVGDSPGSVALHRAALASCITALTCLSTNQKAAGGLQSCCNHLTSSHLLTGNQPRREQEVISLYTPQEVTHTHTLTSTRPLTLDVELLDADKIFHRPKFLKDQRCRRANLLCVLQQVPRGSGSALRDRGLEPLTGLDTEDQPGSSGRFCRSTGGQVKSPEETELMS